MCVSGCDYDDYDDDGDEEEDGDDTHRDYCDCDYVDDADGVFDSLMG